MRKQMDRNEMESNTYLGSKTRRRGEEINLQYNALILPVRVRLYFDDNTITRKCRVDTSANITIKFICF